MKPPVIILLVVLALCAVLYFGWDNEDAEPLGILGTVVGKLGAAVTAATNLALTFSRDREANKRAVAVAIEKYRGPIPFGSLMAICEHESVRFMPNAINPEAVGNIGQARGPWQIMDAYQGDYGVNAATVFEVDASTRGAVSVRMKSHESIEQLCPEILGNLRDYTYVLYLSHFAGRGGMEKQIKKTQAKGLPVTADTVGGYGHEAGLKATADRASYWEGQRDALLAAAAEGATDAV